MVMLNLRRRTDEGRLLIGGMKVDVVVNRLLYDGRHHGLFDNDGGLHDGLLHHRYWHRYRHGHRHRLNGIAGRYVFVFFHEKVPPLMWVKRHMGWKLVGVFTYNNSLWGRTQGEHGKHLASSNLYTCPE